MMKISSFNFQAPSQTWSLALGLFMLFALPQAQGKDPSDDPFLQETTIAGGKYAGTPLDQTKKRRLRVLSPEEAAPFAPLPDEIPIANVSHGFQFWVGMVPKNHFEKVIVQQEKFSQGAQPLHTELKFIVHPDHPIRLVPQTRDSEARLKGTIPMSGLVVSGEFVLPEGVKKSMLLDELSSQYPFVIRAKSMAFDDYETLALAKRYQTQTRLALKPEEISALFESVLQRAAKNTPEEKYHLVFNSCVTAVFCILDDHWRERGWARNLMEKATGFITPLPLATPTLLGVRGLTDSSSWLMEQIPEINSACRETLRNLAGASGSGD